MARKRKRKEKARKERRTRPKAEPLPPIPDRRVMEGILRQLVPGAGGSGTSLEAAQEIMYQAFEADSPRRQVALARKAIQTCPDCADAYVLLAEHAETPDEALDLYEQGVAAGERALGEEGFRQYEGHFWGFLETRPYMRARQGLADLLRMSGRREEAVGHYQEMLRLNPDDNQGIRYLLASALLDLERHADLERLLERYEEDSSAEWAYGRVLLAFRQEGDSERARQALQQAKKTNKHVPAYLTGDKPLPRELPEYITLGGKDEAVGYAAQFLPAWKNTPGATSWLRKTLKVAAPRPPAPRKQDSRQAKRSLVPLPQRVGEVWQADARPLQAWVTIGGEPTRPWTTLVANVSDDLILATDLSETPPEREALWESVEKAMLQPAAGRPHRPGVVQVASDEHRQAIGPRLEAAGIECVTSERLELIDRMIEELTEHVAGPQRLKATIDSPGVTPAMLGSFFDAAAAFYRQAPWRKVPGDAPIRVQCKKFQIGTWYAVVMGQSGMTLGLATYEDLDVLRDILSGNDDDEENIRRASGLSMTFGEAFDIVPRDFDAAQEHKWPVAGPEAYPCAIRVDPGFAFRPPLAWELEFLEGCLRAIPGFLDTHEPAWSGTVPTASGELPMRLSRVEME